MFNLFKKKDASVKVIDKIWMSEMAKWNGILDLWKEDPQLVIITWFDSSLRHMETMFAHVSTSPVSLFLAKQVHAPQIQGQKIIFAEHHPLRQKEQQLFLQLHLKEAIVYSALDEPLFKRFGGDNIVGMMKQLGMKEDAMIEHKMISSSIENAQEKIGKKIVLEHTASSQQEWIERNLPA